jgi:hypothetical protein
VLVLDDGKTILVQDGGGTDRGVLKAAKGVVRAARTRPRLAWTIDGLGEFTKGAALCGGVWPADRPDDPVVVVVKVLIEKAIRSAGCHTPSSLAGQVMDAARRSV